MIMSTRVRAPTMRCAPLATAPRERTPASSERVSTPGPPALSEEADDWSPGEIFWVTSNGIQDDGMPAFEPTHSEDELWDLVALVKRLPQMSSTVTLTNTRESQGGRAPRNSSVGANLRRRLFFALAAAVVLFLNASSASAHRDDYLNETLVYLTLDEANRGRVLARSRLPTHSRLRLRSAERRGSSGESRITG